MNFINFDIMPCPAGRTRRLLQAVKDIQYLEKEYRSIPKKNSFENSHFLKTNNHKYWLTRESFEDIAERLEYFDNELPDKWARLTGGHVTGGGYTSIVIRKNDIKSVYHNGHSALLETFISVSWYFNEDSFDDIAEQIRKIKHKR